MLLFPGFKFLNLSCDLKAEVPSIGNDQFQGLINDLEISHIYTLMKWYTQNFAISFGKTLSFTSELLYQWVVAINYASSKELPTNALIVLKNGVSSPK